MAGCVLVSVLKLSLSRGLEDEDTLLLDVLERGHLLGQHEVHVVRPFLEDEQHRVRPVLEEILHGFSTR